MPRRSPYIRGRGNVAPPTGYRPGLKAGWLKPRPTYHHAEPDPMPFALTTIPWSISTPGVLDPMDNGAIIATIPAGSYYEAVALLSQDFDEDVTVYVYGTDATESGLAQFVQSNGQTGFSDYTGTLGQIRPLDADAAQVAQSVTFAAKAVTPNNLLLGIYSTGTPPTQGAGEIVLKIYS